MELRDPIHGAIEINPHEIRVIDHPFVQRLRTIKQLGFSELSFPGATHNRYSHSIGAMALATRAFLSVFRNSPFLPAVQERFLAAIRLAALLHDVGHPPLSHTTEFTMPPVSALLIPCYREVPSPLPEADFTRKATHEDYTIKIITDSSLSTVLKTEDLLPIHIAALVNAHLPVPDDFFMVNGVNFRPVLSQIISSELDVDRMDYLMRDSYFAGVKYGQFDLSWLLSNLTYHETPSGVHLAFNHRAIYAIDDFLIARYHMFLMIYFHHRAVVYEEMLKRFFQEGGNGYAIPHDIEAYTGFDDCHLYHHLRNSQSRWAKRIVQRDPYKVLFESHGPPMNASRINAVSKVLADEGIDTILTDSPGILSKYYSHLGPKEAPIFIIDDSHLFGKVSRPLEEATDLFSKYEEQRQISRLYVAKEDFERALKAVRNAHDLIVGP